MIDVKYFIKRMNLIIRDISLYSGCELYREFSRLAETVKPDDEKLISESCLRNIIKNSDNGILCESYWMHNPCDTVITVITDCFEYEEGFLYQDNNGENYNCINPIRSSDKRLLSHD